MAQTQPVCLFVTSAALAAAGGPEAIDTLTAMMRDGACPGLFVGDSAAEAAAAAAAAQPGFQLAVRANLRCVLSLNWRDSKLGSLHSVLLRNPELLHSCQCIDWYSDWSQDTYAAVARHWLESGAFAPAARRASQTAPEQSDAIAATAQAAAAAHVTAGRLLSRLYAGLAPESPLLPVRPTPLEFREFLRLLTGLSADLRRAADREVEAGGRLADSVAAERAAIEAQRQEAERARPELEAQLWDVEQQAQAIQQQREKYKAQLDACHEQEAKVKQLLEPLEKMKKESQDSGQARLDPVYEAAIRAAESLQPQHLEEVRSYRDPPEPVKAVMSVVCMLFDTETETWEAAKELMMKEDLQELLLYYDKASMPESKFHRLTAALARPEMSASAVSTASKAAARVRDWLEAVHQFTAVSRDLNPAIGALRAAEERVSREQTRLGRMRVEAQKQLEALNAGIAKHREASLAARQLRQRIARMQAELERGGQLMQRLDRRWQEWRQQRERGQARAATSLGDAFLAAAVATYEVGLPPDAAPEFRAFLQSLLTGCSDWLPCRPQPDLAELLLAGDSDSRLSEWRSRLAAEVAELGDRDEDARRCVETLAALRARLRHRRPGRGGSRWSLVHSEFLGDLPLRRLLDLVFPQPQAALKGAEAAPAAEGAAAPETPSKVRFVEPAAQGQSSRESFESYNEDCEEDQSGEDNQEADESAATTAEPLILSADDPNFEAALLTAARRGHAILLVNFDRRRRRRVRCSPALLAVLDGFQVGGRQRRHARIHRSFRLVVCTGAAFLEESATLAAAANDEDGGDADCELARFHHVDLGWTERQLASALSASAADAEAPELRGQLATLRADRAKAAARLADLAGQAVARVVEASGAATKASGDAAPARLIDDARLGEFFEWLNLETERCEEQLAETLQLADGLAARLNEFATFGDALLPLWKAAKSVRWLSPLYSVGYAQLTECVREGLHQRQSGGGSQLSARVKDLTDACLRATLLELSSRLGEADFDALTLTFALERLLSRGHVRPEQAALLLSREEDAADSDDPPGDVGDRPPWIPERSWPSLARLALQCCPGLLDSLRRFEKLWLEYLGRPVVLAASPPGLSRLSVIEKCLLWKLLKPEAFSSVAQALVNHELGSLQPARQPYSIRRLHDASPDPRQPLVLIRPADHRPMFLSPESAVNQLRAELRPRRLCTVYIGGLPSDWELAVEAFNDCAGSGGWLHLDLVAPGLHWPRDFLESLSDRLLAPATSSSTSANAAPVHAGFRLFISVDESLAGQLLPAALCRRARIAAAGLATAGDAPQQLFARHLALADRAAAVDADADARRAAALHAALVRRAQFGAAGFTCAHAWRHTDLAQLLELYRRLRRQKTPADTAAAAQLASDIYAGHCRQLSDARVVQFLADYLFRQMPADRLTPESLADSPVLASASQRACQANRASSALNDALQLLSRGRHHVADLADSGAPTKSGSAKAEEEADAVDRLRRLLEMAEAAAGVGADDAEDLTPRRRRQQQQQQQQPDSPLTACFRRELRHLADSLAAAASTPQSKSWLDEAESRLQLLTACLPEVGRPRELPLGRLAHPQRLLDALCEQFARDNFRDLNNVRLRVRVLPRDGQQQQQQQQQALEQSTGLGFFLTGLQLIGAGYDTAKQCLVKRSEQLLHLPVQLGLVHVKPVDTIVYTDLTDRALLALPVIRPDPSAGPASRVFRDDERVCTLELARPASQPFPYASLVASDC